MKQTQCQTIYPIIFALCFLLICSLCACSDNSVENATQTGASDIFIIAGRPLTVKANGQMNTLDQIPMYPENTKEFITEIYCFRFGAFQQRGSYSAVIRVITFDLPEPDILGIPNAVMDLSNTKNGMVLVTGPTGGGKNTTLACIIDKINREHESHIFTLKDPLEYLHHTKNYCFTKKN